MKKEANDRADKLKEMERARREAEAKALRDAEIMKR